MVSSKSELIFQKAEILFAKNGYKKVSIDEIVNQAGVAKGTFYLYFKNKDHLYGEILLRYKKHAEKCMVHLVESEKSLQIRLYKKFIGSLCFFIENNIFREILLGNNNYFSPSIQKVNILDVNSKLFEILVGTDLYKIRSDVSIKDISLFNKVFMTLLSYKTSDKKQFWSFIENFAKVIINGVIQKEYLDDWGNINVNQFLSEIKSKNLKFK